MSSILVIPSSPNLPATKGVKEFLLNQFPDDLIPSFVALDDGPAASPNEFVQNLLESHRPKIVVLVSDSTGIKKHLGVVKTLLQYDESVAIFVVAADSRVSKLLEELRNAERTQIIVPPIRFDWLAAKFLRVLEGSFTEKLSSQLRIQVRLRRLVGESEALKRVKYVLPKIAASHSDVLIAGGSGTGKEVFAKVIHYMSARHDKPFVAVDCGNLLDDRWATNSSAIEKVPTRMQTSPPSDWSRPLQAGLSISTKSKRCLFAPSRNSSACSRKRSSARLGHPMLRRRMSASLSPRMLICGKRWSRGDFGRICSTE